MDYDNDDDNDDEDALIERGGGFTLTHGGLYPRAVTVTGVGAGVGVGVGVVHPRASERALTATAHTSSRALFSLWSWIDRVEAIIATQQQHQHNTSIALAHPSSTSHHPFDLDPRYPHQPPPAVISLTSCGIAQLLSAATTPSTPSTHHSDATKLGMGSGRGRSSGCGCGSGSGRSSGCGCGCGSGRGSGCGSGRGRGRGIGSGLYC